MSSETVYVLKDVEKNREIENERLTTQYGLLKARLGRSSPVPPEIDLSSVKRILDVAAGNCVWILDVANQDEIKRSVRNYTSTSTLGDSNININRERHDVELYACDIDLGKFPQKEVTDIHGIKTFTHDLTKPFPDNMKEKFDLIHMSAHVGAL